MKGWGTYERVETGKPKAPEREPDVYYEVARGMDRIHPDGRVDIEIRRGSVTVRKISVGGGVHPPEEIQAHELDQRKVADAVREAIDE